MTTRVQTQHLASLPTDSFVSAAFAELIADVANLLDSAKAQKPRDADEVRFWQRQLNALNKAEYHYGLGVRPQISGAAYLVPSASRPGALIHRLTKVGGVVVCSCEAGQKGQLCFHHMLINVLERASELQALEANEAAISGSGPDQAPPIDGPALLARRLAATAQIIDAMRAAQGRAREVCDWMGGTEIADTQHAYDLLTKFIDVYWAPLNQVLKEVGA